MEMVVTRGWMLVLAALLALLPAARASEAAPPPPEAFFAAADIDRAVLSPSGRWLAMRTSHLGDRLSLVVFDLRDWGKVKVAARFADADIRGFEWVNDERLVFEIIDLKVGGGDQRYNPALFSVRHDGSELRQLIELRPEFFTDRSRVGRGPLPWNHGLLHVPGDGGDEVIVGRYQFNGAWEVTDVSPLRLNVVDGSTRNLAAGSPPGTQGWWFDAQGRPRVVLTQAEGRDRLYWRPRPDAVDWELLTDHERYSAPFVPRFFDARGDLFVTVSVGAGGHSELRRFDFERRAPGTEPVVRVPGFDFRGGLVAETQGARTLGVRVLADAETTVWFDESLKAVQKDVDARLPGRINQLSCRRCGQPDMVVLARSYADGDPGTLLLYRAETKAWQLIGRQRAAIDPARMALLDFHRIKARDGRDLPVWVTRPQGKASAPRPAVVLVHGGPWVRGGRWQWDPMAQFLASRGYVVIEPEFRGSTGYGHAHFEAGIRQWGLAMQDDVADALQWAVARGLVDGKRACIAGASYGGYATLMGLVRHPELYRCGAAWVAVTDPRLMYRWTARTDQDDEVRRFDLPRLIGDPVQQAAQLEATSPLVQAARIKAPVLLAAGGQDRRVPLEHGTRMRDALEAAGNKPEWIVYTDEGHGWQTLKTRVDFAQRLEAFLARHLAPR